MAKATAICTCKTCGNQFEYTSIRKNSKEAYSFEKWAENNIIECPNCRTVRLKHEMLEKADLAAKTTRQYKLPALKGTPKQITWAEIIREKLIIKFNTATETTRLNTLREWLFTKDNASFWIDHKDYTIRLLENEMRHEQNGGKK